MPRRAAGDYHQTAHWDGYLHNQPNGPSDILEKTKNLRGITNVFSVKVQ
jgi:hypothetical protein